MFRLSLHRIHSLLILPALFPLLFMMAEKQSGSPPVAVDDIFAVHGDTQLGDLLLNDSDPDGNPIYLESYGSLPQHGRLIDGPTASTPFYDPNKGFVGTDSFTYRICDTAGDGCSGFATVTLNVANQAPTAVNDTFRIHGQMQLTDLLKNDSDPDKDPIFLESYLSSPQHGTRIDGPTLSTPFYVPNKGFVGTDSFDYRTCDSLGLCAVATVILNVVNQAPTPGNDFFTVDGQTQLTDLLANDSDPDGDPISLESYVSSPQHGSRLDGPTLSTPFYVPNNGFVGTDSFDYRICDSLGLCAVATVTLNVNGQPTPTPTPTPAATPTPTPPPPPPSPTPTPTPTEPLIFIPGITGSTLRIRNSFEVWLGGDPNLLTLDPDPSKQKQDIVAADAFRKTTILGQEIEGYEKLLNMLTTTGGYREYQVNNNPVRRTTSGCDLSQKTSDPSRDPTLFVFAYDWRRSNASSAATDSAAQLRDYVGCVKKFYPESKLNILTHSMGGYIARRYILDNPSDHGVKRVVAIAAPWLGAPKALYIMETGKFFDSGNPIKDFIVNKFFANTFKSLVKFFPSVHQILPSPQYHNLGGQDLGEISGPRNWDVNGNGRLDEDYTPEEVAALLDNVQFKQSKPGQTGLAFHNSAGQDDWQTDRSGVLYYLLYGVQYNKLTIGKVFAVNKFIFDGEGRVTQTPDYTVGYTQGDGTAPLLSTERIGRGLDLNGPAVKRIPFPSTKEHFKDDVVEHTALTANPEVWDAILNSLKSTSLQARTDGLPRRGFSSHHARSISRGSSLSLQEPTTLESGEAYYLTIMGADRVAITDAQGNTNTPIEGSPFDLRVPGVSMSENDISADVNFGAELAADQSYTLTFHSVGKPIEIDLTKGNGNAPEDASQIIRYLDLNLPAGTAVMLKVTAFGVENARYDADGDGVFESVIEPTASAIGEAARDTQAPVIAFNETGTGTSRLISIDATDNGSGVKIVRYSLDGIRYQPYAGPISVNACDIRTVYAIADDNVANRSEISKYELSNLAPDVSSAHPSIATLWPPNHEMVEVSVLGVSDPDCDPVTITITRITQSEPTTGTGDGDTCPDALGVGKSSAQLRAERSGTGTGRVYTIYFTATDAKGDASQGSVKISVPKSNYGIAVNDGSVFDSTVCSH